MTQYSGELQVAQVGEMDFKKFVHKRAEGGNFGRTSGHSS